MAAGTAAAAHQERIVPGSALWAELFSADHLMRYQHAAGLVAGRSVLDAGTGPGYGAALLALSGAKAVQAVDIDPGTVEGARSDYPIDGLEFLVDDCEELGKVRGPVDVVCSFENIEHLRRPERFVESAARLLADDGVLLCSTPDRNASYTQWVDGRPNNPYHMMEWYPDEFRELMSRHFAEVEMWSQVKSHAFARRGEGLARLNARLTYLWWSPALRVQRLWQRLVGNTQAWPDIAALATPSPSDFPIVPSAVAPIYGEPWCLFAVCRAPRR